MGREEKPAKPSEFANEGEVNERDARLLDSPTGRENRAGLEDSRSLLAGEIARHPLGGRPRSEVTGRHDAGSGANETIDGLDSSNEAIRQGAEDVPVGAPEEPIEAVPVFDRGELLPKV